MDRDQATQIKEQLTDVGHAIDRAAVAIWRLGDEERKGFWEDINELYEILYQGLLPALYAQHPELKPPPEPPHISSTLRWDEVSLPPSVTESSVDRIIFSVLKPLWQKTAKVVILAMQRCKELDVPIGDEEIAARLQVLADSGRIEGVGDLRMWRHSEIRLKD
jgi:Protein of unknown function